MKKQQRKQVKAPAHPMLGVLQRPWTPLVLCAPDPRTPDARIYQNSRYQVHLRRYAAADDGPDLVHLSIKRLDQAPLFPYRDKMRLKDELCGSECEGVELFPARSREIDLANQSHLWVIDDVTFRFPLGFQERRVSDVSMGGARQEPWAVHERPADSLTPEELNVWLRDGKPCQCTDEQCSQNHWGNKMKVPGKNIWVCLGCYLDCYGEDFDAYPLDDQ